MAGTPGAVQQCPRPAPHIEHGLRRHDERQGEPKVVPFLPKREGVIPPSAASEKGRSTIGFGSAQGRAMGLAGLRLDLEQELHLHRHPEGERGHADGGAGVAPGFGEDIHEQL